MVAMRQICMPMTLLAQRFTQTFRLGTLTNLTSYSQALCVRRLLYRPSYRLDAQEEVRDLLGGQVGHPWSQATWNDKDICIDNMCEVMSFDQQVMLCCKW